MLKELFESLAAHAGKVSDAKAAKVFDNIKDPRQIWMERNGQLFREERPLPLRRHVVHTIADLAAFVAWWQAGEKDGEIIPQTQPIAFVGDKAVVLLLDGVERRDRVTLDLPASDLWTFVASCRGGKTFDQASLIRELRNVLDGSEGASDLLASVRSLRVDEAGSRTAEISHGAERMGNSVARQALGADKLPEQIKAVVHPSALPELAGVVGGVRLLVDVNLKTLAITLTAHGDDWVAAREAIRSAAYEAVVEAMDGNDAVCTVFRGEVGRKDDDE